VDAVSSYMSERGEYNIHCVASTHVSAMALPAFSTSFSLRVCLMLHGRAYILYIRHGRGVGVFIFPFSSRLALAPLCTRIANHKPSFSNLLSTDSILFLAILTFLFIRNIQI
jgi:hypothetical protein